MKRWGKCVGKKAYAYRTHADDIVVRHYIKGNFVCGVYECPKCLEFHLTSRYDNRTTKMKWRCVSAYYGVQFKKTRVIIHEALVARKHWQNTCHRTTRQLPLHPHAFWKHMYSDVN